MVAPLEGWLCAAPRRPRAQDHELVQLRTGFRRRPLFEALADATREQVKFYPRGHRAWLARQTGSSDEAAAHDLLPGHSTLDLRWK